MREAAVALVAGLLFGLGLIVSNLKNPAKILGFLDLAGAWDPSLAVVMASSVAVGVFAFRAARRRTAPLLGGRMDWPSATRIDRRLLAGALVFGTGWGLAGFCPGPAVVAVGFGEWKAFVFAAAMLAGMALFELIERRRARG